MRRQVTISALLAAVLLQQPLSAAPAPAPAIRLTAADGPDTGSGCTLALDRRLNTVVGGVDYEDGKWHLGINGSVYRFPHDSTAGRTEIMFTANRAIRVEMRSLRKLEDNSNSDVPSGLDLMAVTIRMGNAQRTINAYQYCVDG